MCVNYTGEGPTAGREVRRFSHLSGQIQPSWWGSCLCTFSLTFTHSLVHLLTHSHTLPLTNLYTHSSAHPSPTHALLSSSQTLMHTHSLTLTHSHLLIPTHPAALVNKGNVLFLRGEFEAAREYYQEALSVEATCSEALYNTGLVHKQTRRYVDLTMIHLHC